MEQPDFKIEGESRYPMRSSGKIYSIRKAFRAGCEHVWNTHVVPLQERLNLEKESNHLLHGAMVSAESRGAKKGREEMESENKALREENTKCKELSWEAANEISRLKKEIDRLEAELKNANSALDNISDMGHA